MTFRSKIPVGAPCWTDLWTSDVDVARSFYADLFGWEALEPSPEFGGYFMFVRDGVPVAGGMGPMGDMPASNRWRIYLSTNDINETLLSVPEGGGQITRPVTPVADLGTQAVLTDPSGADLGAWEPGTFPGFTVLNEHGAPSWFELLASNYTGSVEFYRSVFHWNVSVVSDVDDFRYSTMLDPQGDDQLAGIGDAASILKDGEPAYWSTYWEMDDVDVAVDRVRELGGSVVELGNDTPYGRLATVRIRWVPSSNSALRRGSEIRSCTGCRYPSEVVTVARSVAGGAKFGVAQRQVGAFFTHRFRNDARLHE